MTSNRAKLRQFFQKYVDDGELKDFCFDHFLAVYNDFTEGMTKRQKVQLLLDYALRQGMEAHLLAGAQTLNGYGFREVFGKTAVFPTPTPIATLRQEGQKAVLIHASTQQLSAELKAVQNVFEQFKKHDNIQIVSDVLGESYQAILDLLNREFDWLYVGIYTTAEPDLQQLLFEQVYRHVCAMQHIPRLIFLQDAQSHSPYSLRHSTQEQFALRLALEQDDHSYPFTTAKNLHAQVNLRANSWLQDRPRPAASERETAPAQTKAADKQADRLVTIAHHSYLRRQEPLREEIINGCRVLYWDAWDHALRRTVLLKQLEPIRQTPQTKKWVAMSKTAVSKLDVAAQQCRHLPRIYALEQQATLLSVVVEYLPEKDSWTKLYPRHHRQPSHYLILRMIDGWLNICTALEALHQQRIWHLNIRPSTIYQVSKSRGAVLATPPLAIEQAQQKDASDSLLAPEQTPATPRRLQPGMATDIFGLAATAYLMLTRQPPVVQQGRRLRPPSVINTAVSPALDNLLLKALSYNPKNRYLHINAFKNELLTIRRTQKK